MTTARHEASSARFLLTLTALCLLASYGWAEPRSIEEFMTLQDKWPQLVSAPSNWNLEGRYGFIGKSEMKFANCPLRFVLPPNTEFRTNGSKVVEVVGRLEKEGKEIYFQIDRISTRAEDAETIRVKRAGVNAKLPQSWYDLADWVAARGLFYKDDALAAEALDLRRVGLELERSELRSDDYTRLLELARKASNLGLSDEYAREMRHCAYRHQYMTTVAAQEKSLDEVTTLIKQQLPGGAKFLETVDPDLQATYAADPIAVYAAAAPARRDVLDRLFVIELERRRLDRDTKADGSNGMAIANRLLSFLPEYSEQADAYRVRELDFHVSRVGSMTRQEMLDLGKLFEARKEPDRVAEVRRLWLTAREPGLRRDRGRGLCDLAEDWMTLLSDTDKARALYIEAYKTDPGYPLSTVWLTNNGYVLYRGEWIPQSEAPLSEDSEMQDAIREGRIMLGMTGDQVRAAMGIVPSSTLRFASSRGVTEILVFETSGIMVRLHRRTHLDTPKVIAIGAVEPDRTEATGTIPES